MKSILERLADFVGRPFGHRLQYRTQFFLVFLFCLGLLGASMVLLNAYLIAGLKGRMLNESIRLAEEQGRRAAEELLLLLDREGIASLRDEALERQGMADRLSLVLEGHRDFMAVCLMDTSGEVLLAEMGEEAGRIDLERDAEGFSAEIDPSDFKSIRLHFQRSNPELKTTEIGVDLRRGNELLGELKFLVSRSDIYKNIESASREIARRLWGVVLAFIGVLALGFYLMGRLFRRQVALLEANERLDRMAYLGTLASGLAHEIRNPLNAMSVNLAVAREELDENGLATPGDEKPLVHEALESLDEEVQRLNRSVTSFMEFARPSELRSGPLRLRALVDEVLELLEPRIREAGASVALALPEEDRLDADFSGLRQVLYNVVLNALEAAPGGRIEIGARRESAQWFVWIEDEGPGIEPGHEEHIFEVFHTTKAAGSGFGLSIARGIVEAHGGSIQARRRDTGGLRMEIVLPETGGRASLYAQKQEGP